MSEEVKNEENNSKQNWLWLLLLLLLIVFVIIATVVFLKDDGTAEAADNNLDATSQEQVINNDEPKEETGISSNEKTKKLAVTAVDPQLAAAITTSETTSTPSAKTPIVVNISDNSYFCEPVILKIDGKDYSATITDSNGNVSKYEGDATLSEDGKYSLTIKESDGKETTITFIIDKTKPVITGVEEGKKYNSEVTPIIEEPNIDKVTLIKDNNSVEYKAGDAITEDGTYTLTVEDKAGNSASVTFFIDTTAPRLKLNGESKIKIEAGIDTYTELGVTVTDNFDETITNLQPKYINHSINGVYQGKVSSVDNMKLGTYKIVYEHTDTSGNAGLDASRDDHAYVMRIVEVVDTTKPVITLNGESVINHLEKGVDTYTELGAKSTDNHDGEKVLEGPSYINLYLLDENGNYAFSQRVPEVDINLPGRYNLVYTDVDLNGNEAAKVTRMVYVKDTIAPIASIEYNTTDITNKNVVATLKANENVMISNAGTWNPASGFGTIFKKAYSQNTTQLVTITDESGNTNTVEVKIKNIDKTAPEAVKIEYSTTELTNGDVIVTITASEPLYGHLGWSKAGRAYKITKTFTENTTEDVILKDKAGNETIVTINVSNIDKTAPVLTVKDISVGNDPVYSQISFKLSDDNLIDKINVNGTEIDMIDNKWGDANYDLLKGYLVEGKNTVTLYDVAGNQTSKTFTIDWTAPTVVDIEYSTTELTNGNVVVTITTSEPIYGHAGWSKAGRAYKITKTFTKNAEETVIVTDEAGNKLEIPVKVSNIDKTGPTLTVKNESIGTDPYYSKIDFKLFDNNMIDKIDVNGTVVDLSNSKWGDANYDLLKGLLVEGENTVTLYDVVGNKTSKTFIMDWTAPTITVEGFIRDMTFDEFGNWDATGGEKLTASEDVVIVNEDALTSVNGSSKEYEIAYSLRNSTPISYRYTLVTVRDRAGNETTMIDTDGDGGIYIPIYAAPSTTSFRLVKPSAQPTTISEEKQESTEDIIKQEEPIVSEPVVEEKEPVIEEPVIEKELLLSETEIKEEIIVEEPIIKEEPIVSEPVVEEKEPVIEEIPDVTTEPIVEEAEVTE